MALDASATAALIKVEYDLLLANKSYSGGSLFMETLATIIDSAFQMADTSLVNVDITTAAGTLVFPEAVLSPLTATNIANAVADYWLLNIETTGMPVNICTVVPSVITGVTNTADTIAAPIEAALLTIADGQVELTPHFEDFVKAIFDGVMTLSWTVNEEGVSGSAVSPVPCISVWPVTIS